MLIRFAVRNHRSIMAPVELSLVAVDMDRTSVRTFDRLNEGVLPLAAIYGPNASGKSNVLDAIQWLAMAVRDSLRGWDDVIPRDPFRFRDQATQPSEYELDVMIDGVRNTYRVELDDTAVLHEELVSYPERRPRILFSRDGQDLHLRRGLSGSSGIRELLTPVTLALSAARRFDVKEVRGVARYIQNMSALGRPGGMRRPGTGRYRAGVLPYFSSTRRLFIDAYRSDDDTDGVRPRHRADPQQVGTALDLLRFADLGIADVELVELQDTDQLVPHDLHFVHRAGDETAAFSLNEESDGTQAWFRLIGPTLAALRDGQLLLLDEIDASLHPRLSARLLDLFRSPVTNPLGAQLVFTTHDTTLLGGLNRDEVWLTEKGDDGATTLTALAEFGGDLVRRSLNLERAYLQGRFGALPDLDESRMFDAFNVETGDRGE
jgi:uncharacterized protein